MSTTITRVVTNGVVVPSSRLPKGAKFDVIGRRSTRLGTLLLIRLRRH
jgi:hypothetical protein